MMDIVWDGGNLGRNPNEFARDLFDDRFDKMVLKWIEEVERDIYEMRVMPYTWFKKRCFIAKEKMVCPYCDSALVKKKLVSRK